MAKNNQLKINNAVRFQPIYVFSNFEKRNRPKETISAGNIHLWTAKEYISIQSRMGDILCHFLAFIFDFGFAKS